eukprot:3971214-Heterocapsa_arctica.AAC.1
MNDTRQAAGRYEALRETEEAEAAVNEAEDNRVLLEQEHMEGAIRLQVLQAAEKAYMIRLRQ